MRNIQKEIDKKILAVFFTGTRACEWHKPIENYWKLHNSTEFWFDFEVRELFHLTHTMLYIRTCIQPLYQQAKEEWNSKHMPLWKLHKKWRNFTQ
jgi:hypothetical protein